MKFRSIIIFNVIALLLLSSWVFAPDIWRQWDEGLFRFFNQYVGTDYPRWDRLLARMNMRLSDCVSALIISTLFFWSIYLHKGTHWWDRCVYWFTVGLIMLATIGITKVLTDYILMHYRPKGSPTDTLSNVRRLTKFVTDFKFKDKSDSSFPGDHGIVLITCALFMWRFSRKSIALLSILFVVVLSAPRIIIGAHWFSDVYFGSLFSVFIIAPWILYSPIPDKLLSLAKEITDPFLKALTKKKSD